MGEYIDIGLQTSVLPLTFILTSLVIARWCIKKRISFILDIKDKWPEHFIEPFPKHFKLIAKIIKSNSFTINQFLGFTFLLAYKGFHYFHFQPEGNYQICLFSHLLRFLNHFFL